MPHRPSPPAAFPETGRSSAPRLAGKTGWSGWSTLGAQSSTLKLTRYRCRAYRLVLPRVLLARCVLQTDGHLNVPTDPVVWLPIAHGSHIHPGLVRLRGLIATGSDVPLSNPRCAKASHSTRRPLTVSCPARPYESVPYKSAIVSAGGCGFSAEILRRT